MQDTGAKQEVVKSEQEPVKSQQEVEKKGEESSGISSESDDDSSSAGSSASVKSAQPVKASEPPPPPQVQAVHAKASKPPPPPQVKPLQNGAVATAALPAPPRARVCAKWLVRCGLRCVCHYAPVEDCPAQFGAMAENVGDGGGVATHPIVMDPQQSPHS